MRQLFLLDGRTEHDQNGVHGNPDIQHELQLPQAVRFSDLTCFLDADVSFDKATCVIVGLEVKQIDGDTYRKLVKLPHWVVFVATSPEFLLPVLPPHIAYVVPQGATVDELSSLLEEVFEQSECLVRAHHQKARLNSAIRSLTPREQEVVMLASSGMPVKGIATSLGIESGTVDKHRRNACTKLHVRNILEFVNNFVDVRRLLEASSEPDTFPVSVGSWRSHSPA